MARKRVSRRCDSWPSRLETHELYFVSTLGMKRYYAQQQSGHHLSVAIKRGILRRAIELDALCADCGRRAVMYDHRDWRKPLSVVPVCHSCNLRRGAAKPFVRLDNGHPIGEFAASLLELTTEPYE